MLERELAADVERVMVGDGDALQRLIIHYHATLYGVVAAAVDAGLRRRIDADDVLQQAYVAAFKGVAECRFNGPAGFYKWLEAIALSRLRDERRALRRQKRDVAREVRNTPDQTSRYTALIDRFARSESTPSRKVAREEAVAAVMSSLARLTDDQREVIRLRFLEERPVTEVAARLAKSDAAIHMLCHRGLKALRKLMVSITRYLTGG